MPEPEICPICQSPKSSKTSGSLTQWVSTCTCDLNQEMPDSKVQPESLKICKNCGKRISEGRTGSFTQFIFRFDMCHCENPEYSTLTEESYDIDNDISLAFQPELEIDEIPDIKGFPYERFAPIKKLGDGSIGSVYQARDKILNNVVAVKLLKDLDEKQLMSFHQEAKATSKLNHPFIVKVIDFGISKSDTPYMVLQFLPGVSLKEKLNQEGNLDPAFSIKLICQVLEAIHCAHESGIYHRDIKPSNIILSPAEDGSIESKLIDFGIARINDQDLQEAHSTGKTLAGTPLYMSPDQGLGRSFDKRSETYSIGCVLFECITGAPPFTGESALETLQLHANEQPPATADYLDIECEELDSVIQKALAKEPENRFQSARDFSDALSKIKFEKISVPQSSPSPVSKKPISREQLIIKSSLILSLLFIPVIIYGVYSNFTLVNSEQEDKANKPYKLPVIPKSSHIQTFDDRSLEEAAWFPKKEVIRGHNLSDKHLKELNNFPDQTVLLISPPNSITGEGFNLVKDKDRFVNVKIKSEGFDDTGAFYLSKFKNIETLTIGFSKYLTLIGIKYILRLPRLKSLELRFIDPLPEGTFSLLAKKKKIKRLFLGHCDPIKISDLKLLEHNPKLKHLSLAYCSVNDSAVPALLKLNLVSLDITGTFITRNGLIQLARSTTLRSIRLTRCKNIITQSDIDEFYKLNSRCRLELFDEHKKPIVNPR